MPISSYPRITLTNTSPTNNPPSGTGITVFNYDTNGYTVLDSDTIPINGGGFASNNAVNSVLSALISDLGPSVANLLVSTNNDSTAGNNLSEILTTLSLIYSGLANGSFSIQIRGNNGNLADVSASHRLNVAL